MMVGGQRAVVLIHVRRLDERVVRQRVFPAVLLEIAIEPEVGRPQKCHADGPALQAVVVDLCGPAAIAQSTVDTLVVAPSDRRQPHGAVVDAAERRAEVREGAVGIRRARNRCEPVVAHEVVPGKRADGRHSLRGEASQNVGRVAAGSLIRCGESLHGRLPLQRRLPRAPVDLVVHAPEIVRRVDAELPLVRRVSGQRMHVAFIVDVGPLAGVDAAQVGDLVHQQPQHVIERAVLHHQHDDVLDARITAVLVRPHRVWLPEASNRRRGGPPRDHRQPLPPSGCLRQCSMTPWARGPRFASVQVVAG